MWKLCLFIATLWLVSGCAKPVHKVLESRKVAPHLPTDRSIIYEEDFSIALSPNPNGNIEVTYLGCGGFFIKHQDSAILFDPFFSNKGFLELPIKKIQPSQEDIDFGLNKISDLAATKAVFMSHSHFDHLFDTPFILENRLNDQVNFYGSPSADTMIAPVIQNKDRLKVITPGNWITVSDHLRVMPLISAHAPHLRLGFPIKLYRGKGKVIKGYDTPISKTKAGQWKEGHTYSFLIDIQQQDKTTFRIFLQSSASDSPFGFPDNNTLTERGVDLALLGAASFAYTRKKDYPWELLRKIAPKELVICHWEDFCRPYQAYPKRFVRLTNFKKFLPRLIAQYPVFYLPEPGVTMQVTY